MNNPRITFLLPTCEPDSMFMWLLPSIKRLKDIKDLIEFNICFQPPYSDLDIERVLNEFNKYEFKVNWFKHDYKVIKPYTPLIKMRNDCALLSADAEFYCLLDDDMSFLSDDVCNYFLKALNEFDSNNKLAVISLYNQPIENHRENFYSTNGGIIYRGGSFYGFKGLVPQKLTDFNIPVKTLYPYRGENLIDLFGGFQDKFCAMIRLATGMTGLSIINVPINHVENRPQKGSIAHGWDAAKYKEGSIAHFIEYYFNPIFLVTKSLTLFDKKLDMELYPYKYDQNGDIRDEYNIYDNRGFSWQFNLDNIANWCEVENNWDMLIDFVCRRPFVRKFLTQIQWDIVKDEVARFDEAERIAKECRNEE